MHYLAPGYNNIIQFVNLYLEPLSFTSIPLLGLEDGVSLFLLLDPSLHLCLSGPLGNYCSHQVHPRYLKHILKKNLLKNVHS